MRLNTLDIFSGGGGSSYGARMAGANIVGGIDMCEIATGIFADNFPNAHVVKNRLEKVTFKRLKQSIPQIDLLLASPECTNHTCARGARPRSEESRATAMQVIRYARALNPRWLVMENVVHMRPWSRYDELKSSLESLGYHLREQILDAADFGVPQRRRRLFLVGDKEIPPPELRIPQSEILPAVKEILDAPGTWQTSPLFAKGRATGTLERAKRAFEAIGKEASFLIVYYGSDGCGGWQSLDRPLRTITTIDRFALVTPGPTGPEMRMLQVPELRRAMGFEDCYQMSHGTRRDKIRILGNGVCPPVMKAVIQSLTKRHL